MCIRTVLDASEVTYGTPCGSVLRPGRTPWQRTSLHVSSRRLPPIYAPERTCTRPFDKFSAVCGGALPFGQGALVQPYPLGSGEGGVPAARVAAPGLTGGHVRVRAELRSAAAG